MFRSAVKRAASTEAEREKVYAYVALPRGGTALSVTSFDSPNNRKKYRGPLGLSIRASVASRIWFSPASAGPSSIHSLNAKRRRCSVRVLGLSTRTRRAMERDPLGRRDPFGYVPWKLRVVSGAIETVDWAKIMDE